MEVWGRWRGGCVFHIGVFLRLLAWGKSWQLLLGWGVAPSPGLAARGAGFCFSCLFLKMHDEAHFPMPESALPSQKPTLGELLEGIGVGKCGLGFRLTQSGFLGTFVE